MAQPKVNMNLSEQQRAAVDTLSARRPFGQASLSGPAGSGKTSIITGILDARPSAVVVAFTNAAAKVLRRKGLAATTIHKRFYMPEERRTVEGKKYTAFVPCHAYQGKLPDGKLAFSPTIIIDEASMVSSKVLSDLRQMSDEIILVGDGSQLPPVGDLKAPRGVFNTLSHTAVLTEIHRQAEGNPALKVATAVRLGEVSPTDFNLLRGFEALDADGFSRAIANLDAEGKTWKAISFTNATRCRLNNRVRKHYGHASSVTPQPGEIMVCTANYSDTVTNGTFLRVIEATTPALAPHRDNLIGRIRAEIIDDDTEVEIPFSFGNHLCELADPDLVKLGKRLVMLGRDLDDAPSGARLSFGYAVTCHKAQGSEYDHVFLCDERSAVAAVAARSAAENIECKDPLSGREAAQRWLYTALTRTRGGLSLVRAW